MEPVCATCGKPRSSSNDLGRCKCAQELVEGEDYLINEQGLLVFTKGYHLRRGYCCGSGCLNCPYPQPD